MKTSKQPIQDIPDFKKEIQFYDGKKQRVKIEIEITHGNGYPEFTMSGDCGRGSGQCQDSITPKNEAQKKLLALWEQWHLNGTHAGTPEQESIIKEAVDKKLIKSFSYDEVVPYLKKKKKYTVQWEGKKYSYGSGWTKRNLPQDIIQQIESVCREIEITEEEELKKLKFQDINDEKVIALALYLNISSAEAKEYISTTDEETYTYAGQDYYVLTDSEADDKAKEYLDDSRELWVEAVKADRTDDGFEEWKEMVLNTDGRGGLLNSYDGSEECEEVNGTGYYIYRI